MIDILIPVLGRPHNAAPLVENIRATTTVEHQIVFLCSHGDTAQIDASAATDAEAVTVMDAPAGPGDYAIKINAGLDVLPYPGDWIFMAADDVRFEPRWDTIALRDAGHEFDVIATNDLANAQVQRGMFGTHCLIRRRYVTEIGGSGEPGKVLYEGYDHNFVDRELCHRAQHLNTFVFSRHSRVRHYHPLWKTAVYDATYKKALQHFRVDQQLFVSRAHLWGFHGLSATERKMAA